MNFFVIFRKYILSFIKSESSNDYCHITISHKLSQIHRKIQPRWELGCTALKLNVVILPEKGKKSNHLCQGYRNRYNLNDCVHKKRVSDQIVIFFNLNSFFLTKSRKNKYWCFFHSFCATDLNFGTENNGRMK